MKLTSKMIQLISLLMVIILMPMNTAHSFPIIKDKVIYGDDNRQLLSEFDLEQDKLILENASVVFAQIPNWRITKYNKDNFIVETKSLYDGLNYCHDEKFSSMPLVSACTAFLIGPDLIATAGHCLKDKYDCKNQTWVLDYNDTSELFTGLGQVSFKNENSYSCRELISHGQTTKLDYAIIKLDRTVMGRRPLKLREAGKVSSLEPLIVIGHPLGLPKVVTSDILIRDNSLPNFFKTNADVFSGNSGSPVIGIESGLVEGILIRGEDDFSLDVTQGCQRSLKCLNNDCRGESILRSTLLPLKKIHK